MGDGRPQIVLFDGRRRQRAFVRTERREGYAPEEAIERTLTTAGRGIVFNALSVVVGN